MPAFAQVKKGGNKTNPKKRGGDDAAKLQKNAERTSCTQAGQAKAARANAAEVSAVQATAANIVALLGNLGWLHMGWSKGPLHGVATTKKGDFRQTGKAIILGQEW